MTFFKIMWRILLNAKEINSTNILEKKDKLEEV
jgi:hypothetical protein